jgi:transcriptional regulator with XRE-family HTH domain
MTTKKKYSKKNTVAAIPYLEKITGGPLTFARLIHSTRLCEEKSATEFAKILGISKSHLCDIEKGRKSVSIERAVAFAEALGHSEYLFVELALQTQVNKAGLDYKVSLEVA